LQQIRADIAARRRQGINVLAMQLASACSNFGAERMKLLCSSLQAAGKTGDFALATGFADRLEAEFKVVKSTLEDFIKSLPIEEK
jgi:HPt (histidine-containing phosphotransfer) domain-containing protein